MRVTVDARSLTAPMTGTGVALMETLRALGRLEPGDEYRLLATRPVNAPHGTAVSYAPAIFRRAGSLFFRYALGPTLQSIEADAHWATLQVGPAPRTTRRPVLLQMHDLVFRRFPETMSRKNSLISSLWVEKSLETADMIYCVSEHTRRELLEWKKLDAGRVRCVPNGVSDRFRVNPDTFDARTFRREHRLPERYALFVGTLEPRKNLSLLLDALPETDAFARGDAVLVVIGGHGWRNREAERKLEREIAAGRAVRCGYVPPEDLPGYYAAAELFIFPSLYEGFGLPVVEAMAAGTPVLCSDAAALQEVGGGIPRHFPARDGAALAGALDEVLAAPALRADMSVRGRQRATEFSWDHTARRVRNLLHEIG